MAGAEATKFFIKKSAFPQVYVDGKIVQENTPINLDRCKYIKIGQNDGALKKQGVDWFIEFVFLGNYSTKWLYKNEYEMDEELDVLIRCDNPCECEDSSPPN